MNWWTGLIAQTAVGMRVVKNLKKRRIVHTGFTGIFAFRRISVLIKIIFPLISVVGGDANSGRCGYYIHLQPGCCLLGGGVICPEPALLKRIRQDIYEKYRRVYFDYPEPEFIAEFPELDTDDKLKESSASFPRR